jgi:aspartyl-tRNA(Asn)/glutamyl-tRNA(Gln) amidotransferase subunit C
MPLTEKDVRYVAGLAHLELSDAELKTFLPQLDSILGYMEKLNELDTTNVDPMAQVTYPSVVNPAVRADAAKENFGQDEALANAPEPGAGHFKVPQVIDKED